MIFRKPRSYTNRRRYPQGGKKRRIGRGVRQLTKLTTEVAKLKDFTNAEFKWYDILNAGAPAAVTIPQSTNALPDNASTMLLNGIPQGVTESQREGISVKIKSVLHQCVIAAKQGLTTPVRVRMIMFLYLRPLGNAAVPSVSDLLQVAAAGNTQPMVAPRKLEHRSRFSILHDKVYSIEPAGMVGEQRYIKIYKKLNFHTLWDTTTTGDNGTGITKNSLWCMYFADGNDKAEMYCDNRIRYIDN